VSKQATKISEIRLHYLGCASCTTGGTRGPPPPDQLPIAYHVVLTSERWQNVHKPQVSRRPTCNVWFKHRRIPIQYPSWSAKGFGEATELLIARWSYWTLACFLLHDNVTNANERINIFTITAGCRKYRLFITHNSYESVTTLPRPLSRLGRGGIWAVDSQENHYKMLPTDVRFKGYSAPKSISAGGLPQTPQG